MDSELRVYLQILSNSEKWGANAKLIGLVWYLAQRSQWYTADSIATRLKGASPGDVLAVTERSVMDVAKAVLKKMEDKERP